eukprot:4913970-Pleurochrysis_carterae.AAC.2
MPYNSLKVCWSYLFRVWSCLVVVTYSLGIKLLKRASCADCYRPSYMRATPNAKGLQRKSDALEDRPPEAVLVRGRAPERAASRGHRRRTPFGAPAAT